MAPAMTMPVAGPVPKSTFVGAPSQLAAGPHRRPCAGRGQRQPTQAILEKVREAIAPSNGASTSDWKPKSDSASVTADVLQNLGAVLTCMPFALSHDAYAQWGTFSSSNMFPPSGQHADCLLTCRVYRGCAIEQDPKRPGSEDSVQGRCGQR